MSDDAIQGIGQVLLALSFENFCCLQAFSQVPENFNLHRGLDRTLKARAKMMQERNVDWALGEAFAFGTLLMVR